MKAESLLPLAGDRSIMLEATGALWERLRGEALFITGGTGYVGCWMLEALLAAIDAYGLGCEVHVLSRDPEGFEARVPHLATHPAVRLHQGDVRDFAWPAIRPAFVVAGAAEASAALNADAPLMMLDTLVEGTRRTLEFARHSGARSVLLVSSGAVYGVQPADCMALDESYLGGPATTEAGSAYGEGKRVAELLAALYGRLYGLDVKIARGFAFSGAYLPLDRHFAAGNFVRDALAGGPIRVAGDGTPLRSYMYGADLAVWLWTILLRGTPGAAYNVGSDEAVSIRELAEGIAGLVSPACAVAVAGTPVPGRAPSRYVPAIDKARDELGLRVQVPWLEGFRRMIAWHREGAGA